jgi:hypothetical protein
LLGTPLPPDDEGVTTHFNANAEKGGEVFFGHGTPRQSAERVSARSGTFGDEATCCRG